MLDYLKYTDLELSSTASGLGQSFDHTLGPGPHRGPYPAPTFPLGYICLLFLLLFLPLLLRPRVSIPDLKNSNLDSSSNSAKSILDIAELKVDQFLAIFEILTLERNIGTIKGNV